MRRGTQHAVCGNKWLQWERVGVVPYVRMRQTESVHAAILNVSARGPDTKYQGVKSLQTCFPI